MIDLIEDLYLLRQYYLETFFLAVSISDNYLIKLNSKGENTPCLFILGATSLLLAAKIEQHKKPCFLVTKHVLEDIKDI